MPLAWKLLAPLLLLMIVIGALGAFVIVRDLSARAETALDGELSRRALEARTVVHERELSVLESVNLAANMKEMGSAIAARDTATASQLARSVLALKTDLTMLAVTELDGAPVAAFERRAQGARIRVAGRTPWRRVDWVRAAFGKAGKSSGFLATTTGPALGIVGPVCSSGARCETVGWIVAATDAAAVVRAVGEGVAAYDTSGTIVAARGPVPADGPTEPSERGAVRRTHRIDGKEFATLHTALIVQGRRLGTLSVTTATAPVFAAARGAGIRLATVLLLTMAGVLLIGTYLHKAILRQVEPLVATNRALGAGDLSARAPVLTSDEIGELAQGVNEMAAQLQHSYETLETRVAERTAQIEDLLKERTEFFAALSHDLRTPLAVIRGQTDMLLDPSYRKDPAVVEETARTVNRTAAQLLAVVNDILSLARAEAGELEVDIRDVELDAVVRDVQRAIAGLGHEVGVDVRVDVPAGLPRVKADPVRLREIIMNLADNAVKYTPSGGSVELRAAAHNGHVALSIADSGVGIPADAAAHVFEPFFRAGGTETQHGQPSSGLGLAVVKRLVDAHGASIDFTSVPGEGTTFTIKLKRSRARPGVKL